MEIVVLALFCLALLSCIVWNLSILYALVFGLLLFCTYGRHKQFSWGQLTGMCFSGVKTVKEIVLTFLSVGALTALWRACGTIPVIVCYAAQLIRPSIFLLMTFLLNCGVSFLTGTAFGTAATMGLVCMTMSATIGIHPAICGGAILSGSYFGDRCSPVSTSALLVCSLTHTDTFENIKRMCKTAFVPFLLACALYALVGLASGGNAYVMDVQTLFARGFQLHWLALLPAAAILVLSACKVPIRTTMFVSVLLAFLIALTVQHVPFFDCLKMMVLGYRTSDSALAAMLNGGGMISMLTGAMIVVISSCYAGIFRETGLLEPLKNLVGRLSRWLTPYGGMVGTSLITAMIACNQTLTILLTHQLCGSLMPDDQTLALNLEDTAVIVAPLIPWSIAGALPLAAMAAPTASILAAWYLMLIPVCRLVGQAIGKKPLCLRRSIEKASL